MAEFFDALTDEHQRFIERQHVFFVATAAADGRVNLSPKGGPSVVALGPDRLLWLNLTGSGNETAAHLLEQNRITLMWTSFEGPPLILRVYGRASAVHPDDPTWDDCVAKIPASLGARQYFEVAVESVQTSCGYQTPLMDYREDRKALTKWAEKKGEDGIRAYWSEKNAISIDGLPTRRD
ncbi:MAG: pyridoxamine 5'-phosphate oxidase family protein [Myxococcota bacterium]